MNEPRILHIKTLPDYKLELHYETGETKIFDVTPYIRGQWYGELKNESYFSTVKTYPNGKGIEWENGQDIAPHELYEASILQSPPQ